MMTKRNRGRPIGSRNVRVTPEFRREPDIKKLGRALIAVALRIAEQNNTAAEFSTDDGKGDTVA